MQRLPFLRRLYDWTLAWAGHPRAPVALGAVSFVESSVFPIPADVLFVPMCLARPAAAYRLAFLASLTSVLGGIAGWLIGHYAFDLLARPLLEAYGKMGAFEALRSDTGMGTILLLLITSGLSHVPPMKVVTILSGLVGFDLWLFIGSAIVARGGRFYLLAFLLRRYGVQMRAFLARYLSLFGYGLLALGLLYLLWKGLTT